LTLWAPSPQPCAAARMAKLPAVRSACAALSILYKDAKGSSPGLRVLCEALESRVGALSTAACSRAAPLMVKLEPQISIANDVACRSLDWLEASFPVIQSPTDQVTIKTPHTIATEPTELTPPHVTGRRLSQNQDA
uniref:Uncharacterized protein n=1 Tax=Oryzias melastigma TaxID=30732 RepID=A0A3B3D7H4_ORYME